MTLPLVAVFKVTVVSLTLHNHYSPIVVCVLHQVFYLCYQEVREDKMEEFTNQLQRRKVMYLAKDSEHKFARNILNQNIWKVTNKYI